jgi:hypothetical protein
MSEQDPYVDDLQRAQIAAAISWLARKWGEEAKPCPYCGTAAWHVGTPQYIDVGFGHGEPGFSTMSPTFPVMCSNCGNTVLINAVLAGLVEPEPPHQTSLEESEWQAPDDWQRAK